MSIFTSQGFVIVYLYTTVWWHDIKIPWLVKMWQEYNLNSIWKTRERNYYTCKYIHVSVVLLTNRHNLLNTVILLAIMISNTHLAQNVVDFLDEFLLTFWVGGQVIGREGQSVRGRVVTHQHKEDGMAKHLWHRQSYKRQKVDV